MISNKQLADVIVTALEGGSNHFIGSIKYTSKKFKASDFEAPAYSDPDFYGKDFEITVEIVEDDPATLDRAKIDDGWEAFVSHYPTRAAAILDETYDADDADIAIQFFLFGAYVYG